TTAARATRLAQVDNYPEDNGDDDDVYEYNQDDELAQYFAQADAALNNLNTQQQHPSVIYGGDGGASTIDLYGRGGAPAPAGGNPPRRSNTGKSNTGRGGYY
ncbi:hypothetical protein BGX24_003886, partial [Mortierella sp. AD032]